MKVSCLYSFSFAHLHLFLLIHYSILGLRADMAQQSLVVEWSTAGSSRPNSSPPRTQPITFSFSFVSSPEAGRKEKIKKVRIGLLEA